VKCVWEILGNMSSLIIRDTQEENDNFVDTCMHTTGTSLMDEYTKP
jgi:hypothetical protein